MSSVYIGIGSNLGDRTGNCLRAVELLVAKGVRVSDKSSLYETEPWGMSDQPGFINMVVSAETDLAPRLLLGTLHDIETEMGRHRAERWGPRIIDLDILLYDDLILKEGDLEIPHPLMHEREFVLRPLSEIAPQILHPVLNLAIRELLDRKRG